MSDYTNLSLEELLDFSGRLLEAAREESGKFWEQDAKTETQLTEIGARVKARQITLNPNL
jgi:hypothetical protein